MITINGKNFYEEPSSCGVCPFMFTGNTDAPTPSQPVSVGHCTQFDEMHHTWKNVPRRCAKLFRAAFDAYNDSGVELVITKGARND